MKEILMKTFDKFIPEWLHKKVVDQLLNPQLDWHFPSFGGMATDIAKSSFAKQPFNLATNTFDFNGTDSLMYALDCWLDENQNIFQLDHLHRCMINFYTPGQNTGWHQDMAEPGYYSLLYYVNDADGGTKFDDTEFVHKENSALMFDCRLNHSPISSTVPRRISVNWIMKGKLL
jgi:hypothetical protein